MNPHLLLASKGWNKPDYDSFHSLINVPSKSQDLRGCEGSIARLLSC